MRVQGSGARHPGLWVTAALTIRSALKPAIAVARPSAHHTTGCGGRARAGPEVRRSIDIWPASIPLEDDLAGVAAEDDLKLPAADGRGVPPAHRARRHLVHVGGRQGIDLDFQ